MVRFAIAPNGMIPHSFIWHVQYSMAWQVWYDMKLFGMVVWYSMVCGLCQTVIEAQLACIGGNLLCRG